MNNKTESEVLQEKENLLMGGVSKWTAYYRANPHKFARDYLGLNLRLFQQVILWAMFRFPNAIYLASRGGGKTFLMAIFCTCYCILYPGSWVRIASKTRGQATETINKIQSILMPLSANLRSEISRIKIDQSMAKVWFKNASEISVVTAGESARSNRATVLICDEYRLIDKTIIDTILKKFLSTNRQPAYLQKAEFKNAPKERTKAIYASSCWYKDHYSFELVRDYAANMLTRGTHFCCAMPYQLAIKEDLLDRARVEDDMMESDFNIVSFTMEMEALFWGKGNGSWFAFNEIDKSRRIKYPYLPKRGYKVSDKKFTLPEKQKGEIRIMSADIALMSSSKNKNDATSLYINQMLPTASGKFTYNIIYPENNEGMRTDAQALNIRKLFEEFDCDYLALDCKGFGLSIADALMADMYDATSGETYNALSCCNNEEIAKRCSVKGAPKKIWAIHGSQELNSRCASLLRESFRQGQIRLLINEYDGEDMLNGFSWYRNLSPEEQVNLKMPYIQTTLLVNELVGLDFEVKNNSIKIKEKSGQRKDRYSSLSYNVYVAKEIEREQNSKSNKPMDQIMQMVSFPKVKKRKYFLEVL